jgi:hypothetical protein
LQIIAAALLDEAMMRIKNIYDTAANGAQSTDSNFQTTHSP